MTFGVGIENEDTFVQRTEQRLRQTFDALGAFASQQYDIHGTRVVVDPSQPVYAYHAWRERVRRQIPVRLGWMLRVGRSNSPRMAYP